MKDANDRNRSLRPFSLTVVTKPVDPGLKMRRIRVLDAFALLEDEQTEHVGYISREECA